MSAKFRPEAFTRTRISPLAGTGSGRVSTFITSTPPLRVVTTALMNSGLLERHEKHEAQRNTSLRLGCYRNHRLESMLLALLSRLRLLLVWLRDYAKIWLQSFPAARKLRLRGFIGQ